MHENSLMKPIKIIKKKRQGAGGRKSNRRCEYDHSILYVFMEILQ
jgi:hypothetical protein